MAREIGESQKAMTKQFLEGLSALKGSNESGESDSYHRIQEKSFYDNIPTIDDNDPDIETYNLMFANMVATYSYAGKKPKPVNVLHWYKKGFKEGSIRRQVYDYAMRIAVIEGRDQT